MKYIKKFELIDNYSIWKNSDNYIAPNVSMIDNDDEDDIINYNPLIIINPSVTMNDWTYGETASNPVISGNTGNGTVTYLYKVSSADDSTYTSTKPTDAGTYTIKANINAIRDYSAGSCTSTFTISKANINPSVTIEDWNEGDTASNPSVNGNLGNGIITYMYKVSSADDSTYTSTKPTDAGTYTVRATIWQTNNYNGASCTSTFEIISSSTTNNIITYTAFYQLTETTISSTAGLHINAFNTTIKSHVFENGVGIIKFNDNVTSIGNSAFYGCSDLTSITIPDSVTSIGNNAFDTCSNLTSITSNATIAPSIQNYTFQGVPRFGVLNVPNNATGYNEWLSSSSYYLGYYYWTYPINEEDKIEATYKTTSTSTSIKFFNETSNVIYLECNGTRLPPNTYYNATAIGASCNIKFILKDKTSFVNSMFQDCLNLISITIPDSVTSIGTHVFSGCSNLTSLSVDSNNAIYDSRNNCNAIIETATNKLIIGCQNTIIPNSVTSIGDYAFYYCRNLISITIPDSVTSIGDYVFYWCSNLTSITCNRTTAPTIQRNTFNSVRKFGLLIVPTSNSGYDTWMNTSSYDLGYTWKIFTNEELDTTGTQELTEFYWSKESIYISSNYYTLPELTKPNDITIEYSSSNTNLATINSSGTVTVKGSTSYDNDGVVYIAAIFKGNSTYKPKMVGYRIEINMYTPPSSGGGSYGGGE